MDFSAILSELGPPLSACVTCDGALQDMILGHHFWLLVATVAPITLVGGFLIAFLASIWARSVAPPAPAGTDPGAVPWTAALLGAALAALLDGIVFHQVLQVHDMISNTLPPTTLLAKNTNMFWSGIFHVAVYALLVTGIASLWRLARRPSSELHPRLFWGALVAGFGAFQLYDTVTYHGILRLHDIVEVTSAPLAWNIGWGIFGAVLVMLGGSAARRCGASSGGGSCRPAEHP